MHIVRQGMHRVRQDMHRVRQGKNRHVGRQGKPRDTKHPHAMQGDSREGTHMVREGKASMHMTGKGKA